MNDETETEIVARAFMDARGGCLVRDWQGERRVNLHVEMAWKQAQAAITALDKHRIERAGKVEQRLIDDRHMTQCDGLKATLQTAHQAAATIAALKAQIERLTERDGGGGA